MYAVTSNINKYIAVGVTKILVLYFHQILFKFPWKLEPLILLAYTLSNAALWFCDQGGFLREWFKSEETLSFSLGGTQLSSYKLEFLRFELQVRYCAFYNLFHYGGLQQYDDHAPTDKSNSLYCWIFFCRKSKLVWIVIFGHALQIIS